MIKTKKLKQPKITKSEITKALKYQADIKKNGYRPWVTVRASHTHGQGHIIHSPKFGRQHHLLSRGERLPFFIFERELVVVDILEQYPLPISETMKIAKQLNIVHPGAYKQRKKHGNKIPAKTMTTDFVVVRCLPSGECFIQPYSFKYAGSIDIEKQDIRKYQRTKQKIRIEEIYWENQGKPLTVLTEKDFDRNEIYNLEFFRECYSYSEYLKVDDEVQSLVLTRLRKQFLDRPLSTLKQNLVTVAKELNITDVQVLALFQQAVYEFKINLDLSERIELYRPLPGGLRHAA